MSIKNIIDIENSRNDDEFYLIHLFKEGNWWSAYELSAYLCHIWKNNLKDKLKINKKHLKKENIDYIKIGLQKISFDKYLPNNEQYITFIDDEHMIIDSRCYIDYDINKNNYLQIINEIKNSIEIKQNKENIIKDNIFTIDKPSNFSIFNLLCEIDNFDVKDKTYEELISFILKIKGYNFNLLLKLIQNNS